MIVAILVNDGHDAQDYEIGSVRVPEVNHKPIYTNGEEFLGKRTPDGKAVNVHDAIDDLWCQWREEVEHPDCDSEFIDWLVANHGWKLPEEESLSHVIEH